MEDSKKTTVVLDLDNKEFMGKLKESLGLMGELGESDSIAGLAKTFAEVGAVVGVVAVGVMGVKAAIDFTEQAEKIKQIETSFETLAASVGLSGDALKEKLLPAAKGLASESELLQAANKAIVQMGENASHIPETMEIARKATALFGGDLISNFERINQGLATGNARMLRQYGIIVENDKAQKDFAKSLGVGVEYLDEAGKKQAFFNAALEKAHDKFKDVNADSMVTTDNIKRMSVDLTEMKEAAILAWDKMAGPYVKKLVAGFADAVHTVATEFKAVLGTGKQSTEAQIALTEQGMDRIKARIAEIKAQGSPMSGPMLDEQNRQLEIAEKRLSTLKGTLAQTKDEGKKEGPSAEIEADNQTTENKFKNMDKLRDAHTKFEKELLEMTKAREKHEEEIEDNAAMALQRIQDEELRVKQEADLKASEAKRQLLDKGVITTEEYEKLRLEIYKNSANQIVKLEKSADEQKLKAMQNLAKQSTTVASGISSAFAVEGQKAGMSLKNFSNLGSTVFNSFKGHAVSAFKSLGDGSKNAADAMKGFMFGAIGDIAQAHGEVMLAEGMGTFNPIEVAEGGALIALGSAISAMGNSSSSVPSGAGGGGGGVSGSIDTGSQMSAQGAPTPAQTEKKSVTVNIAGNHYETEQTRTRLMDLIREAGDFTDFQLKQIGQP